MWIEKRDTGYKFREKYRDPMTGKEVTVSVTLPKRHDKKARELLAAKIRERTRSYGDVTLQEAVDKYLKYQEQTLQPQTVDKSRSVLKGIVAALGGDNLLRTLTAGYVNEQLLAQKDKKAGGKNEQISRLKSFVRWCYRHDLIDSKDWIDKIEPFNDIPHRVKIQDKFLEAAEFRVLVQKMPDKGYALMTEFLGLSGMRISELIGLDKQYVYEDELEIAQTYEIHAKNIKPVAKTATSFRIVHLQPQLKDCLDRLIAFMDERKARLKITSAAVCVDRKGSRVQYDAYRQYLGDHSEKIIGRRITPHVLRHTHASLLAEKNVPIDTAQRRLGHSHSRITKDIYTHVTQVRKRKDDALLDDFQV